MPAQVAFLARRLLSHLCTRYALAGTHSVAAPWSLAHLGPPCCPLTPVAPNLHRRHLRHLLCLAQAFLQPHASRPSSCANTNAPMTRRHFKTCRVQRCRLLAPNNSGPSIAIFPQSQCFFPIPPNIPPATCRTLQRSYTRRSTPCRISEIQ